MSTNRVVTDIKQVTVRFSGDSGDGMQLSGTLFSTLSAIFGNEISTFPDFPAEIRAPQGSLHGVSGFQKDRFIVIEYCALRGKDNEYLGVLEVTQDITKLRSLEGNQRLLSYEKK
jgi:hypothetical protein